MLYLGPKADIPTNQQNAAGMKGGKGGGGKGGKKGAKKKGQSSGLGIVSVNPSRVILPEMMT